MALFDAAGDKYDRFMGRYAAGLAPGFADAAGVEAGMRVLDVGCGTGVLAEELARRVGAAAVTAIDPSPPFAARCRERVPGADVREGAAEELPFADDTFDAALASLVVAFMRDADAGVAEMARVTRPGRRVGVCMWDVAGGRMTMLRHFWQAVDDAGLSPEPGRGERALRGVREGDLGALLRGAALEDVREGALEASVTYQGFDDLWEPFTYGVGPAGAHLVSLDDGQRDAVREALRARLGDPQGSFGLSAWAWVATGRVP
jgi:SAM-dependent methyltransferase